MRLRHACRQWVSALALVSIITLSACGQSGEQQAADESGTQNVTAPAADVPDAQPPAPAPTVQPDPASGQQPGQTPAPGSGEALPLSGLQLYLEADAGVRTTADSKVTEWQDQSGSGNDLTAVGTPTLLLGALNGHPVVAFDGSEDKLEGASDIDRLPTGNADRSVYVVVNYQSVGFGGFAWGNHQANQTFGLVVKPDGNLMVQGWGVENDFSSETQGTGQGWMVESAILSAGQLTHYVNGNLVGTKVHTYDTQPVKIVLGAEIDGDPYVRMQAAALLVYDRALSSTEQLQVLQYLQGKYLSSTALGNEPPVANADAASLIQGASLTIDVLANDVDPDGALDSAPAILFRVSQPRRAKHGAPLEQRSGLHPIPRVLW